MTESDSRGANALTFTGLIGVAACLFYLYARVSAETIVPTLALTGLTLALLIAGVFRRWWGRTLPGSVERLHALQAAPGPVTTGIARLFAFALDFAVLAVMMMAPFQLFRRQLDDPAALAACYRMPLPDLTGLAFLHSHMPCFSVHGGIDELATGLLTLGCGLYLLVPAATWGATPGLLLIGRVWVRSDGQRVGAVHGVVRALVGLVLSPLQALFGVLMLFNFANRYRNVRTGEKITIATWGLLALARRPRTIADMCCRTEAIARR